MYQLIQILSKFFQYFMYQPQHLPCFKFFFCILCTNRSPSPVDLHSSETSADPHHITDTPHQATHAPPHTRRYVPTPPASALPPYFQPYSRTTARTTPQTHTPPPTMISLPPAPRPDTRRPSRRSIDAASTQHRHGPRRDRRARRRRPPVDAGDGVDATRRR